MPPEEGPLEEGQGPGKHRERVSVPGPTRREHQHGPCATPTIRAAPPWRLGASMEVNPFTLKQLLGTEAPPRWSLCGSPKVAIPSLVSKHYTDLQAPPLSSGPANGLGGRGGHLMPSRTLCLGSLPFPPL